MCIEPEVVSWCYWFKGKSTGNHGFHMFSPPNFPVAFVLFNQFWDALLPPTSTSSAPRLLHAEAAEAKNMAKPIGAEELETCRAVSQGHGGTIETILFLGIQSYLLRRWDWGGCLGRVQSCRT